MVRRDACSSAWLLSATLPQVPRPDENFAATLPEEDTRSAAQANGAIYQAGHDQTLFDNAVARRVGDVLTITLVENTNAAKSAVTTTKKTTTEAMAAPDACSARR